MRWLASALATLGLTGGADVGAPPVDQRTSSFRGQPVAPEVLFTPLEEENASFTSDGRTVYFTLRVAEGYLQAICVSHLDSGHWSEPAVLPFSGRYFDADPFVTPDGSRLYFVTNQTVRGGPKRDLDIWVADRDGERWQAPHPLEGKLNSQYDERSPVLTRTGRLYFSSNRSGRGDLFVALPSAEGFGEGVPLGSAVNTPTAELELAVSPDERTLVFSAFGRPDIALAPGAAYPRSDLYLSHWTGDQWGPAVHLGPEVNTAANESAPAFSADGRTLYFVSERGFATDPTVRLTTDVLRRGLGSALNGRANVYQISADLLGAAR